MRPGRESQTAVMVCAARAAAHGRTDVPRFDDPVAMRLLPDEARRAVERLRAGTPPADGRERMRHVMLEKRAAMAAVRTVAVDDAVREAAAPQVVVLGAGLDGRAWRMPSLAGAVVFEVDHPDSQRRKRERTDGLAPMAREVRFVDVDFTRDDLDERLARAGHDADQPTTWILEGVVMYLTKAEVDATVRCVARRSAPGSRLVVVYHAPALLLVLVGLVVRRVGEPLRSVITADEMRALLARHGFAVRRDDDLPTIARALSARAAGDARRMKHMRVVVAERT
jgi:methyltransferase (TIGR00027 family)